MIYGLLDSLFYHVTQTLAKDLELVISESELIFNKLATCGLACLTPDDLSVYKDTDNRVQFLEEYVKTLTLLPSSETDGNFRAMAKLLYVCQAQNSSTWRKALYTFVEGAWQQSKTLLSSENMSGLKEVLIDP